MAAAGCSLVCAVALAKGTAGSLDFGFGEDGWARAGVDQNSESFSDVAVDARGRIVAAGQSAMQSSTDSLLVRFRPDGTLDQSFPEAGLDTYDLSGIGGGDLLNGLSLSRGKIVTAGTRESSNGGSAFIVARFLANGRIDADFGSAGVRNVGFPSRVHPSFDNAFAVATGRHGSIVAVGESNPASEESEIGIARLRRSGALDRTFSKDGRSEVAFRGSSDTRGSDVAFAPGGRIVASATVRFENRARMGVVAWKKNGRLDRSFGKRGRVLLPSFTSPPFDSASAAAIAVDGKGRIVVGGTATSLGEGFAVARLLPSGKLDKSFSDDGRQLFGFGSGFTVSRLSDLAIQGDGKIVTAGSTTSGGQLYALARLRPNGELDPGFGDGGRSLVGVSPDANEDTANALDLAPQHKIVLAGSTLINGGYQASVARYLGR
jgi:uncharacterized delta-60 repeat protein